MRDYYKIMHADWFAGVNEAKKEAAKQGGPFTQILKAGQASGKWPVTPEVDATFLALQAEKTLAIREHILGVNNDVAKWLRDCGEREVAFYESHGQLDAYARLNGIS